MWPPFSSVVGGRMQLVALGKRGGRGVSLRLGRLLSLWRWTNHIAAELELDGLPAMTGERVED